MHSAVVSSALLAAVPGGRGSAVGWSGQRAPQPRGAPRRTPGGPRVGRARPSGDALSARPAQRAAELGIGLLHELGGPDISSEDDFASDARARRRGAGAGRRRLLGRARRRRAGPRARRAGRRRRPVRRRRDRLAHRLPARVYADDDHVRARATSTPPRSATTSSPAPRPGCRPASTRSATARWTRSSRASREAAEQAGRGRRRAGRGTASSTSRWSTPSMIADAGPTSASSHRVQPAFDRLWGGETGMYVERLGRRPGAVRSTRSPRWRPPASALALGSDSPVTPLDPWGAVRAAVRHRTPGQSDSTVAAAFAAHTAAAGWHGRARRRRRRPAGRGAGDLRGVDRHRPVRACPRSSPTTELPTCRRTVVRGTTVYEADRSSKAGSESRTQPGRVRQRGRAMRCNHVTVHVRTTCVRGSTRTAGEVRRHSHRAGEVSRPAAFRCTSTRVSAWTWRRSGP